MLKRGHILLGTEHHNLGRCIRRRIYCHLRIKLAQSIR